ncbi:MAG: hypothetical protein AAF653_07090, partial [Chloroflexota bacterium]
MRWGIILWWAGLIAIGVIVYAAMLRIQSAYSVDAISAVWTVALAIAGAVTVGSALTLIYQKPTYKIVLQHPVPTLLAALSIVPPVMLFTLIATYSVEIPLHDEWDLTLATAVTTASGDLTFADWWTQHNNARPVLPRMFASLWAVTHDLNLRVELSLVYIMAVMVLILLLTLVHAQVPELTAYLMLPLSAMVFSLPQYGLWLWIGIIWIPIILFLLLGMVIIQRREVSWGALIAAALTCVAASLCHAGGFVTWVALLVMIWMIGYRKWQHIAFWITAAVTTRLVFLIGYVDYDPTEVTATVSGMTVYFLTLLSAPFTLRFSFSGGALYNLLIVVLPLLSLILALAGTLYIYRRTRTLKVIAPWVTLLTFGIVHAALITWSRAPFGQQQAQLTSRYVATTNVYWYGVVIAGALAAYYYFRQERSRRPQWVSLTVSAYGLFVLTLMMLHVATLSIARGGANRTRSLANEGVTCILRYLIVENDTTCMTTIYPIERTLPVNLLDQHGLSTLTREFALAIPMVEPSATVYVPVKGQLSLFVIGNPENVTVQAAEQPPVR